MSWFVNYCNKLYIKALLVFNPTLLFEKINQLDWYKQLLQDWVHECNCNTGAILEVGCSTGVLTQYLSDIGSVSIGVDLSQKSIDQAKTSHPTVKFQVDNILNLSFEDRAFDAVIAASVINIVGDKKKAVSEIIRVCKPAGTCSILVPDSNFSERQFISLLEDLNLSGFSLMALKTWNKLAPKMASSTVTSYFPDEYSQELIQKKFLNGMVCSYTLKKH